MSSVPNVPNGTQGFFEGDGGAIYNKGDITVEGEAYFRDNTAGVSGRGYIPWYAVPSFGRNCHGCQRFAGGVYEGKLVLFIGRRPIDPFKGLLSMPRLLPMRSPTECLVSVMISRISTPPSDRCR